MTTLKTNAIEPEGATTNLTVGMTGQNVVVGGSGGIKANTFKDAGGNTLWTSNGSGVLSSVSGFGGAQVLLNTTTISSGTSEAEFTLSTHTTYDCFVFDFINLHPSMGSSYTYLQVAASTGSYGVTTTSTAFQAWNFETGGTPVLGYVTGEDLAQSTSNQNLGNSLAEGPSLPTANDASTSGEFHLFNPHSTTYVKNWYCRNINNTEIGGTYGIDAYRAGYYNTTSAITAIKFVFSAGADIDAGIIKMYGIK